MKHIFGFLLLFVFFWTILIGALTVMALLEIAVNTIKVYLLMNYDNAPLVLGGVIGLSLLFAGVSLAFILKDKNDE